MEAKRKTVECPINEVLRAVVEARLADTGLSQNAFAKQLGIPQPLLSMYLKRRRGFSLRAAVDFSVKLGLDLNALKTAPELAPVAPPAAEL